MNSPRTATGYLHADVPAADPISIPGFADPFSSLSHLSAAAVFAALSIPLIRKGLRTPASSPRTGRILSLAIFAASAVFLLSMSGAYHLLPRATAAREILRRLDHAAIFVLIAGTFTPIHTILFRGPARWASVTGIWTIAALGVILKSIYFLSTPATLGLALYVGMGWLGGFSIVALRRRVPGIVTPLLLGGLAYTAGAAVEWTQPPPLIPGVIRAHEVFHLAVILGLSLHWRFIWSIADVTPNHPIS